MTETVFLSDRRYGYVVGICILLVATLGFLVGFSAPYWHFSKNSGVSSTMHGLWLVCEQETGTLRHCKQTVEHAESWLRGVQFLEVMALIFFVLAILFVVFLNCGCYERYTRLLEIFAGFAALFSVCGFLCYVFLTLSPRNSDSSIQYHWAFGINATGSLLTIIAAILIAVFNKPPTRKRPKFALQSLQWPQKRSKNSSEPPRFQPPERKVTGKQVAIPGRVGPLNGYYGFWDKRTWLLPPQLYWISNVK